MPVVLPKRPQFLLTRTPVASAVLVALASPSALAQQETTALGEVIVTAQKRAENLQDVPISIDTMDTKKLDEMQVQGFKDYALLLPSVVAAPSLGTGSGGSNVYMRGVATGGDGQATTSQPSVGMYLDEQPITTIQGNLDIHMYDIARVEALAARRVRCTARARRRARSGSSQTSRIPPRLPRATAWKATSSTKTTPGTWSRGS
jgi:iron complex outermembrane recepter protein